MPTMADEGLMVAVNFKKAKKVTQKGMETPPSQCECLNPSVIFLMSEYLADEVDSKLKELRRFEARMEKLDLLKCDMESLEKQREGVYNELVEAAVMVDIISKIPSCKSEGR